MKRLVLALVLCAGCGHGGTKKAVAGAPMAASEEPSETVATAAEEYAKAEDLIDSGDEASGMLTLEHACDLGSVNACSQMGMLYANNVLHDLSRADIALGLLDASCAQENAVACTWAGSLLEHGVEVASAATGKAVAVVPEDKKSALAFYTKACSSGFGLGCDYLAQFVRNEGDIRTFIKIEDKACVLDAEICRMIGDRYVEGVIRPKDSERAAKFYKQGCDNGEPRACEGLAGLTDKGLGVKKDKRAAKRLYQKACEAAPELEESCVRAR